MTQPSFNPHGAVDLAGLANRAAAPPTGTSPGPAGAAATSVVVDVTEADFQALVIETSMKVPVVIDFWADWCEPCKLLSPVLEKLAVEDGGRWLLAKIDLDSNQQLGQAFQVQGIPAVFAVVKGQPIPLFQGVLPEAKVREYLVELMKLGDENGVNGQIDLGGEPVPVPEEPQVDPRYDEAYEAIERGDLDAAAAAYSALLAASPGDPDAKAGLGQVELLRRTESLDDKAVREAAAARPDDVQAQTELADLDLLLGNVEDAFSRLVDLVRRTSGEDRDHARTHLVGLLELVGNQDERVGKARTALANALF
jgi:putative thioredoxin